MPIDMPRPVLGTKPLAADGLVHVYVKGTLANIPSVGTQFLRVEFDMPPKEARKLARDIKMLAKDARRAARRRKRLQANNRWPDFMFARG